jgi:hypothetical protein
VRIRFNVKGYTDRRSTALLASHDLVLERIWRARVARNEVIRASAARAMPREPVSQLLRVQAG